MPIF
jgi:hypothetical protein